MRTKFERSSGEQDAMTKLQVYKFSKQSAAFMIMLDLAKAALCCTYCTAAALDS
jgi:hypothetical protein